MGGVYAWRVGGERHLWSPQTVASLQKAVRLEDARSYEEYARAINDQGDAPFTLRGCLDFATDGVEPVPSTRSSRRRKSCGASRPGR